MNATLVRKVTVTAFGIAAAVVATVAATPAPRTELVVYKSATCGCCNKWVDYLRKQGFSVVAHDTSDMTAVKAELGVPDALSSCHTAIVGGYVIEGHVPVSDIARLLKEHPKVVGLSVPGMVTGSPGMEGGVPEHYKVVAFDARGNTTVFASY
ncbi:MAG: hypothetical protein H6Q77_1461 [Gemmatimonadetes bacterium]|jgi:hypothetical protein|nr:hypothetical protein [Gemmatimonadota bacterium]